MINKRIIYISFLFLLSCASAAKQANSPSIELSKEIKKNIYNSCFEVLIEKPVKDSLTYEKALPLDEIPYNIRNDKYYSIGTAFAISETELISAFHVLSLSRDSLIYPKMFIRDRENNVFEISNLVSFDSHKDFVKFTVRNRKFSSWFVLNRNYELDEPVYSVGNAYGEGIVIRKGDLIGTMSEPESNKFKLLKSSSDVSAGNSGGPLLDKKGEVVGVVLSRKDNISYSLPVIELLNSKPNKGYFHTKMKFGFNLIPEEITKSVDFDVEMTLPKDYKDIKKEYKSKYAGFYFAKMDEYFQTNSKEIFPQGESSLVPLYDYTSSYLLQAAFKNKDNKKWAISNLEYKVSEIKNNGSIRISGLTDKIIFTDISKPSNISLQSLLENPKTAMDLLLEGFSVTRNFAQSKIRILSYGKPEKINTYVDKYNRKWSNCVWISEYSDEAIIVFTTPTPQGLAMIMLACQTADIDLWTYDLKHITDFIYISYYGKMKEWVEFMAQKNALSPFLNDIKFSFDAGKGLSLKSKRFSIDVDKSKMDLNEDTFLGINYGYIQENNKPVWDIRQVRVTEEGKSNNLVLLKHLNPDKRLNDDFLKEWDKIIKQDHPYNGTAFEKDGVTNICSLHSKYTLNNKNAKAPEIIYSVFATKEGKVEDGKMKEYLNKFMSGIKINE